VSAREDPDLGYQGLSAYVCDGSTWTYISTILDGSLSWKKVDITSKISDWDKVDACLIYLKYTGATASHNCYVDCMRLKVTTAAASTGIKGIKAQVL